MCLQPWGLLGGIRLTSSVVSCQVLLCAGFERGFFLEVKQKTNKHITRILWFIKENKHPLL